MIDWDRSSVARAIGVGALTAAVLDMLDPIIFYGFRGVAAIKIPQSVASGLLGRASYAGGAKTAVLGLVLHVLIALIWASLFVYAARVVPFLYRQWVLSGLLYGVLIYLVMNYAVLPLSQAFPRTSAKGWVLVNGIGAMVLLVGPAISWANQRFTARRV